MGRRRGDQRSRSHTIPGRGCASHFNEPHVPKTVDDGLEGHVGALAGTEAISAFEATVRELVGPSVSTGGEHNSGHAD
jgi:hypothetical protein